MYRPYIGLHTTNLIVILKLISIIITPKSSSKISWYCRKLNEVAKCITNVSTADNK